MPRFHLPRLAASSGPLLGHSSPPDQHCMCYFPFSQADQGVLGLSGCRGAAPLCLGCAAMGHGGLAGPGWAAGLPAAHGAGWAAWGGGMAAALRPGTVPATPALTCLQSPSTCAKRCLGYLPPRGPMAALWRWCHQPSFGPTGEQAAAVGRAAMRVVQRMPAAAAMAMEAAAAGPMGSGAAAAAAAAAGRPAAGTSW